MMIRMDYSFGNQLSNRFCLRNTILACRNHPKIHAGHSTIHEQRANMQNDSRFSMLPRMGHHLGRPSGLQDQVATTQQEVPQPPRRSQCLLHTRKVAIAHCPAITGIAILSQIMTQSLECQNSQWCLNLYLPSLIFESQSINQI